MLKIVPCKVNVAEPLAPATTLTLFAVRTALAMDSVPLVTVSLTWKFVAVPASGSLTSRRLWVALVLENDSGVLIVVVWVGGAEVLKDTPLKRLTGGWFVCSLLVVFSISMVTAAVVVNGPFAPVLPLSFA